MGYNSNSTGSTLENVIEKAFLKDNTTEFTPASDYNPATKKYVDDTVASVDVTDQISGKADTTYVNEQLDTKVDKVTGKQLSTNDYTTTDKNKLAGIEEGAEVNVNADWNATSGDAQILNKPTIITEAEVDQKISTAVDTAVDELSDKVDTLETSINSVGSTLVTDGDGTKYLSDNGEYKTVASSPLINEEYGNIVNSILLDQPETISQEDYDKLYSLVSTDEDVRAYCEALDAFYGIVKIFVIKAAGEIHCYWHTQLPFDGFHTAFSVIFIKSDLTVTIEHYGSNMIYSSQDGIGLMSDDVNWFHQIELLNTGDGNSFLSNSGEYVEIPEYELPVATSDTLGGIQVGYSPTANTFAVQLDASNNAYVRIPFAEESCGLMTEEQFNKVDRLRNYTTSTTVASLNVNYENIYVTLSANASLSASATGADYDGRSVTAYVYTDASYTITIPTTGNYVSMCGSSFTTTAGGWVEFNMVCINGIWHIAKLEQE